MPCLEKESCFKLRDEVYMIQTSMVCSWCTKQWMRGGGDNLTDMFHLAVGECWAPFPVTFSTVSVTLWEKHGYQQTNQPTHILGQLTQGTARTRQPW